MTYSSYMAHSEFERQCARIRTEEYTPDQLCKKINRISAVITSEIKDRNDDHAHGIHTDDSYYSERLFQLLFKQNLLISRLINV